MSTELLTYLAVGVAIYTLWQILRPWWLLHAKLPSKENQGDESEKRKEPETNEKESCTEEREPSYDDAEEEEYYKFFCLNCTNQRRERGYPYLYCYRCGDKMVKKVEVERKEYVCLNCSHTASRYTRGGRCRCEKCEGEMAPEGEVPKEKLFVCQGCFLEEKKRTEKSQIECSKCGNKMKPWPKTDLKLFVCSNCSYAKFKENDILSTNCEKCGNEMKIEEEIENSTNVRNSESKVEKSGKIDTLESGRRTKGYVYIAVNPEIPKKVKIGQTKRAVRKRMNEISRSTGVPGKYRATDKFRVDCPEKVEKKVHLELSHKRVETGGEFFRISPEKASKVIKKAIKAVKKTRDRGIF